MQRMGLHGWTVRPSSGCVFCLFQRLATLAQQRVPKLSKERSARWPGAALFCGVEVNLQPKVTERKGFRCKYLE